VVLHCVPLKLRRWLPRRLQRGRNFTTPTFEHAIHFTHSNAEHLEGIAALRDLHPEAANRVLIRDDDFYLIVFAQVALRAGGADDVKAFGGAR